MSDKKWTFSKEDLAAIAALPEFPKRPRVTTEQIEADLKKQHEERAKRKSVFKVYDPSEVTFTWGGVPITRFSEGTVVMSSSYNRTGSVTIKLVRSGRRYQIRRRARSRKRRRGY